MERLRALDFERLNRARWFGTDFFLIFFRTSQRRRAKIRETGLEKGWSPIHVSRALEAPDVPDSRH